MTMQPVSSTSSSTADSNDGFPELLRTVKNRFQRVAHDGVKRLFRVDAGDLYDLFLSELPRYLRQHYTCRACRDFVETLKSEYHAVRSVLEAHFKQAVIAEHDEEHACGLALSSNTKSCRHVFRAVSGGLATIYTIDRWD